MNINFNGVSMFMEDMGIDFIDCQVEQYLGNQRVISQKITTFHQDIINRFKQLCYQMYQRQVPSRAILIIENYTDKGDRKDFIYTYSIKMDEEEGC